MSPESAKIREQLAQAVISKTQVLDLNRRTAGTLAKNTFFGASKLAKILGYEELAEQLHESFSIIVEAGIKPVEKWAGMTAKISNDDEKEAA